VRAKINQPSEVPDIGDKEETVNAEQDLALKDDQVSTKENQPEQETVVSEEINQSADFPETVTVDAADLVGEAKANQESFVRESKVSVTAIKLPAEAAKATVKTSAKVFKAPKRLINSIRDFLD
jgi:D-alanyl-D-alanine carboxypeptidase